MHWAESTRLITGEGLQTTGAQGTAVIPRTLLGEKTRMTGALRGTVSKPLHRAARGWGNESELPHSEPRLSVFLGTARALVKWPDLQVKE